MATAPFFLVWPQRPSHLLLDGTTRLEFPRTYLLPGRLISVRRLVKYYNLTRSIALEFQRFNLRAIFVQAFVNGGAQLLQAYRETLEHLGMEDSMISLGNL